MTDGLQVPPLVLDFDASVLPVAPDERRLDMAEWQEAVRFGCTRRVFARLATQLRESLPKDYGWVFTGSGDFHHLTLFLLEELARRRLLPPRSLDVVVCDNHPDNMRYPFGIHCGSWVWHAARLACVRHIHVVGITSEDIGLRHAWENHVGPFWSDRLTYWSIGSRADWLRLVGCGQRGRAFANPDALLCDLLPVLADSERLYLSIDKDVFAESVVRTNWDQGVFALRHVEAIRAACGGRLVGADITGDVSAYAYKSLFKRILSRLDGQEVCAAETLRRWQSAQQVLNRTLLVL